MLYLRSGEKMALPQVLLNGVDIYQDYVKSIEDVTEDKTYDKLKLITNVYNLPVINYNNYFSINNVRSPFNNTNWLYMPLEIIDENNDYIWIGDVTKFIRDHASIDGQVQSKDRLFRYRDNIIEYESADWETGADVLRNIFAQIGFTNYSVGELQRSIDILEDAGCYMVANFNESSKTTLRNVIEKIGIYSNCYTYTHNGVLYCQHYTFPNTKTASFTVTPADMRKLPAVEEDESGIYNDYSIGHAEDGGTPETDTANNNIGEISRARYGTIQYPEMRTGDGNQIIYKNAASAVYIGEGKIRRGHKNLSTDPKPLTVIDFEIDDGFKNRITLDTVHGMTLPQESWTNKNFQVFTFTTNRRERKIVLKCYEVN